MQGEECSEKFLLPTEKISGSTIHLKGFMSAKGLLYQWFQESTRVIWNFETEDATTFSFPALFVAFFNMTVTFYILPRWTSCKEQVFHLTLTLLSACGAFVETSLAILPIKHQGTPEGHLTVAKKDRCDNLSWTCTANAKKGERSLLKKGHIY